LKRVSYWLIHFSGVILGLGPRIYSIARFADPRDKPEDDAAEMLVPSGMIACWMNIIGRDTP